MNLLRPFAASVAFLLAATIAPALATTRYSGDVLVPPPPGTVLQDQIFHPYGEGTMSRWHAVLSRKALGSEAGTTYYQWYLSLYGMGDTHFELKYQSPSNGGPFDRVEKPVQDDAHMWLPVQDGKIVGIVDSTDPDLEQLVVQSQQMAADCGAAEVDIFAWDQKKSTVVHVISVANGCDLTAKIVEGEGDAPDSIALSGPYYKESTPMCCPIKNSVTTALVFHLGQWLESAPYFKLYRGTFPR